MIKREYTKENLAVSQLNNNIKFLFEETFDFIWAEGEVFSLRLAAIRACLFNATRLTKNSAILKSLSLLGFLQRGYSITRGMTSSII